MNEETLNKAREILLYYVLPTALIKYPRLQTMKLEEIKNLKAVAIVDLGTKFNEKSLQESISTVLHDEYSYDFSADKNILIKVPTDSLGSSTYVVFEV